MDMQIKFAEYADATVVRLDGELDEHTAAQVRQAVDMAIDMCRQRVFVFDFSKLSFVDKILQMAGIYSIIKKTS